MRLDVLPQAHKMAKKRPDSREPGRFLFFICGAVSYGATWRTPDSTYPVMKKTAYVCMYHL